MEVVLSKNLKRLLNERDMTVAELSRATSIAPQTLNNWLSGQEPRSLLQLGKVAKYFSVSVDFLAYGVKDHKSPIQQFHDEINAGVFEVVLRRVKKD